MRQHAIASLLGILLGLTACAIAAQVANVARVALEAQEVERSYYETGTDTSVMDY